MNLVLKIIVAELTEQKEAEVLSHSVQFLEPSRVATPDAVDQISKSRSLWGGRLIGCQGLGPKGFTHRFEIVNIRAERGY
jgi:hypothetical protein